MGRNERGESDEERSNEKLQVKWEEWVGGGRVTFRERVRIETDSDPAWSYNRHKLTDWYKHTIAQDYVAMVTILAEQQLTFEPLNDGW